MSMQTYPTHDIANQFALVPAGEYAEGRQTMTRQVWEHIARSMLSDWCMSTLMCNLYVPQINSISKICANQRQGKLP